MGPRPAASAASRADLYRALVEGGEKALAAMAELLGYEERPSLGTGTPRQQEPREPEPTAEKPAPEKPVARPPTTFWCLEEVEHLTPAPAPARPAVAPIGLEGIGLLEGRPPRTSPIVSDARLWAALRRRLGSTSKSRQVDVRALADSWSRGRIRREIPYRALPAWTSRVLVLVDGSAHLGPVRDDQRRLISELKLRLGKSAVRSVRFTEGMERPWKDGRERRSEPPFEARTPAIALSDLGFVGGLDRRAFWVSVALSAERADAPLAALVPVGADRWERSAGHAWNALPWERPERAPEPGPARAEDQRRERAERLLSLLAFASRIEPGLLRSARRLLSPQEADQGTELDAWNLAGVAGGFASAAVVFSAELRHKLEERFRAEDPDRKGKLLALQRSWRRGQPKEIWLDEVLALDAAGDLPAGVLRNEEVEAARALWERIGETLESGAASQVVAEGLSRYVREAVGEHLPKTAWDDESWSHLLSRAWKHAWKGPGPPPLPPGVGSGVLDLPRGEARRGALWQVAGDLVWSPSGASLPAGSPLAAMESSDGLVTLAGECSGWSTPRPLGEGQALPRRTGELLVLTDRTRATLRRIVRPAWAQSVGRDRHGLWATLAVGEARQKMRWIAPGRFWMGSPEDEPGRYYWEQLLHLVEIKNGFWLGETPCTQALWLAVMGGGNPSEFQTPDRPVERVSWDDCQEFLGTLRQDKAGGEIWRLPTEQEWEYACRAGTETATYEGSIEIKGEHNAPVLGPIAWYGGNSGVDDLENGWDSSDWTEKEEKHTRAATHPVALKRANPWGLYDMLGNVWEWCHDSVDPEMTPNPEGPYRVFRGGSWYELARNVRAAYRYWYLPSDRDDSFGFRLARGQESALRQGAEPRGAERPTRGLPKCGTRRSGPGPRPEAAAE